MAFEALPIPNVLLPFAPQYTTLLKPLSTIPEYPIPVFSKPAWRPASVHLLGPKLPDALATLIIHHLRGDQASLRALSLTHKAVLPAVHKLLFQNIVLSYEHRRDPKGHAVDHDRLLQLFTPSSGLMAQMDFPRPYNTPDLLERLVIVEGNANDGTDWIEYRKPDPPNPFLKFSLFVPPTCNSHDFNEALKFMARGCKGLKSLELRMDPPPSGKSLSWGPPISPQDNSSYGPPQKRTCIVWSSLDEREREALLGLFRVPVTYMVILEWNFHFHSLVDWFHFLKSCVNWRGSVTMTWPTVSGWGEPMLEGLPKHIWDIIVAEIVENNPQRLTPLLISSPKLSRLARASLFRTLTVDSESRCRQILKILSKKPHLAELVERLCIHEGCKEDRNSWVTQSQCLSDVVALIPNSLPNLQHLELRHHPNAHRRLSWDSFSKSFHTSFTRALREGRIRSLSLQFPNCYARQVQWLRVCQNLLHLEELRVWLPHIEKSSDTRDKTIGTITSNIQRAWVYDDYSDSVLSTSRIAAVRLFRSVESLVLKNISMAGVDRILEGCLQVDRTRPRQNTTQIGAVSGPLVMYGPNHLDLEIDYHEGTAQPLSSSPASRGMSANPQLRYNSFRLRFLCSTAREILAFLTAWSRRYARMTHFPRLRTVRLDVTFDNIPGQRLDDDESLSAWKTIASRLTTGLRMQSKFDVSDDLNPNLVGDSPTADPNGNWGSNLKGITISLKIKTLPQRGELGIDVDLWLKALQELRNFGLALEFQILNTKGTSLWQWKSSRVPST